MRPLAPALALVLLCPSSLLAQQQYTPPLELRHPITGERGTWIPLWLERKHVLTDQALDAARTEIRVLENTLLEANLEIEELKKAVELAQRSEDHLLEVIAAQENELKTTEPRLERRTRALWGTSCALALALALGALGFVAW